MYLCPITDHTSYADDTSYTNHTSHIHVTSTSLPESSTILNITPYIIHYSHPSQTMYLRLITDHTPYIDIIHHTQIITFRSYITHICHVYIVARAVPEYSTILHHTPYIIHKHICAAYIQRCRHEHLYTSDTHIFIRAQVQHHPASYTYIIHNT